MKRLLVGLFFCLSAFALRAETYRAKHDGRELFTVELPEKTQVLTLGKKSNKSVRTFYFGRSRYHMPVYYLVVRYYSQRNQPPERFYRSRRRSFFKTPQSPQKDAIMLQLPSGPDLQPKGYVARLDQAYRKKSQGSEVGRKQAFAARKVRFSVRGKASGFAYAYYTKVGHDNYTLYAYFAIHATTEKSAKARKESSAITRTRMMKAAGMLKSIRFLNVKK